MRKCREWNIIDMFKQSTPEKINGILNHFNSGQISRKKLPQIKYWQAQANC